MKTVKFFFLSLTPLLFAACSNMTIGLEEDSRFYNGPLYDNREESAKKDKVSTSNDKQESIKTKYVSTQNETTFSYERDDE